MSTSDFNISSMDYKQLLPIIQDVQNKIALQEEALGDLKTQIRQYVSSLEDYTFTEKEWLEQQIYNAIEKYDIIQPLLDDPTVSEIMINGPHHLFIERKGELESSPIQFQNEKHLMQLVQKIATEIDRPINLSKPILDARLKDGSRVNIVLSPVAGDGPVVTIRKFSKQYEKLSDLLKLDFLDQKVLDFLSLLVKSKYNLFICGGTGSGKTTLLNCLSSEIPLTERIITIEDSKELQLVNHQNLVSLETRESQEDQFDINMSHLIKTALRMRPDRIVVGEVRGQEVMDMLQAMNTGHDGSMSTGHGNSPKDMLIRLESIGSSYSSISSKLIRSQIISAIDFIIYIERLPNGQRKLTQICEIIKDKEEYALKTHYHFYEGLDPQIKEVLYDQKYKKYQLFTENLHQ